jgi:hypothetical protein
MGRRRVGHGGPGRNFRESVAIPCHTPMLRYTVLSSRFIIRQNLKSSAMRCSHTFPGQSARKGYSPSYIVTDTKFTIYVYKVVASVCMSVRLNECTCLFNKKDFKSEFCNSQNLKQNEKRKPKRKAFPPLPTGTFRVRH